MITTEKLSNLNLFLQMYLPFRIVSLQLNNGGRSKDLYVAKYGRFNSIALRLEQSGGYN